MASHLSLITLVVDDYDRAIDYYTNILGFSLIEDQAMSATKRWVVVSPHDDCDGSDAQFACHILLAKAVNEQQKSHIGNQTGGRVSFFLKSDQFDEDYQRMRIRGVEFMEEPRSEPYGRVVVFRDPFGNMWDFLEAV